MLKFAKKWTYGAELEYGDLDRTKPLPKGCGWDVRDYTMVNSNGIAVDPTGKTYPYGGEINTRPTKTIAEQVALFEELMRLYPEAACNYRSNLHIHVGIPDLDLEGLKKIQKYVDSQLRGFIDILEPIPKPTKAQYPDPEAYEGARRRYRRRCRSHHTFIPSSRVVKQLEAKTVDEFFELEVPHSKAGAIMWHAQARACVNLRQMRETGTIEFRHFPGTKKPAEFEAALLWCREFLIAALHTGQPVEQLYTALNSTLPTFPEYDHELETNYRRTVHDGSVGKTEIAAEIERIVAQRGRVQPW